MSSTLVDFSKADELGAARARLRDEKRRVAWARSKGLDTTRRELNIADRVWRTRSQLELAIVEYIGWFNDARLHQALGDLPPSEFETLSLPSTFQISLS